MSVETIKVEPADSEQDEEEDVYEVERIIDMRVEEGEVLYRVRWKNYCSDDDTWEPEAHLEDCREVLLTFKKSLAEAKAKKEAEAKKSVKPLPIKSDVFDADAESDSDKDRPTDSPIKKKKKKKIQDEEESSPKEKKKKKKEKRRDEVRPLPAPETDDDDDDDDEEEEEEERPLTPSSPPKEKKTESKKRVVDSEEEDEEPVPPKKHKKEKGKDGGKHKKDKAEEGKKKKGKKDRKIETSEDEATAPIEDDISEGPSESQLDETTSTETAPKSLEKLRLDDKFKQKKGKWEVKLQGFKDLIQDRKIKKPDATQKESSLQKLKSLTSKAKEDPAPHSSDSSDSSTLHKKAKSKGQENTSAPPKVPSSSTSSSSSSSSVTAASSTKGKEDEVVKEDVLAQKDTGSTNLFEKFLLNCEAKDRAPRRQPLHQPATEKTSSKSAKMTGKTDKIPKPTKESPVQKPEPEKAEKTKQSDAPTVSRTGQSYGFSLDSDEKDGEESTPKPREDSRERKERMEETQRPSWERRTSTDNRTRRREDSEPRLYMACEDNQDTTESLESADKSDKGQATLSLGMDLNLDWMTLDDFQKHLNGEDEILSGPPLSPSELRDAVKSGDYMAVKLALNSKEDYNLDQEACTIGEKRSFEEERSSSDALRLTSNLDNARSEAGSPMVTENITHDGVKMPEGPTGSNTGQVGEHEQIQKDKVDIVESINIFCDSSTNLGTLRKEGREQADDKMSDDTNIGLTSIVSVNFDESESTTNTEGIIKRNTNIETNSVSTEQSCSEEDSSDDAEELVASDLDSSEQTESDSDLKEMDKAQTHQSNAVKKVQPKRTSVRTSKKVLETPQSTTGEEKRESCKKHFCLYCKVAFTQLTKHLERRHSEETDVAHAINFPKGSKIRQTLLDQIRNKGDYEHNCKVLRSGEGEIVTKKQVKNSSISVRDFLPCQYCFAFYRKTDLWRHERSCKAKKEEQQSSERTKKGRVHSASSRLLPMSEFLTGGCEEIIHIMHQDDISRYIRNDPLICKYGNALAIKYDHDKSQFAYIAQKMRELGRFILAVNELDNTVQYLHEVCLPSRFELAVEGAKRASGFDPASSTFKTVSLVSKIGYSLKRAAEIAFGESRMAEDSETESEVKKFIQLLDTKWNDCFSRKALALTGKQEVKKVEVDKSTVTEDLMKLHQFITGEEDEARKELKESPSLSTWKKLSEATLADVCLFNRGRVGNIGRMLLQTYSNKKNRGTFAPSADQIRKSTKLELVLGDRFTRLELEGQYGRNMLVLLTERMVLSIDLLIGNREQAGVSKNNPYLFARTEGPSFIRGLDCFRRAAMECGVKNPEALLSSSLREQIASCWQLMSLCEPELDQVANLVGRTSQEVYSLSKDASQLEEVSKQLLKMDRTLLSSVPGTAKEGTVSKAAIKRRPWSEKEQAAVKRFLGEFITKMKVPGKKECNACISAEPDLVGRSWTDVKNYVHNTLQTIRRRCNQPKPEGNTNVENPKSQKAGAQNTKKNLEDVNITCTMTTGHPDDLRETENCCLPMAPPSNLREAPTPFPQEMTSSYASLCTASTNMVYTSPTLLSTFAPLNATDTQVVPTYTPHNTTNALLHSAYSPENNHILTMSPPYTPNATSMLPPSVYSPQDASSSMIPSFTPLNSPGPLNAPSTSMIPTFTQLNTPMVPSFSSLHDRNGPLVSSFAALNHSSAPPYPASPPRSITTAQVVPTIHGPGISNSISIGNGSSPLSTTGKEVPSTVKKRIKRLWSEEEQTAVRRQLGDFCKLVKVPGKKECDACLAAEPALNTRTWREVKYFVHNSIQSMKRRGIALASKQPERLEPEIQNLNPDWDGPVYLSL